MLRFVSITRDPKGRIREHEAGLLGCLVTWVLLHDFGTKSAAERIAMCIAEEPACSLVPVARGPETAVCFVYVREH